MAMLQKLRTSVSFRVSTLLVVALAVMLAALCGFFIHNSTTSLEQGIVARGKSKAQAGAAAVSELFEQALRSGRLKREDVFSEQYDLFEDGEVKKYHTRYDAFADEAFDRVGQSMMQDPDILFAGAFDNNGYIPTHTNPKRSKRKFDDPVGIKAAHNQSPDALVQLYHRDTGEWAWDVSQPITIEGQHWGAYRIGISKAMLDAAIRNSVLTLSLSSIALILILSAFVFVLLRRALKPLDRIEAALGAVARGDLSHDVPVTGQDEIGRMSQSYQTMIGALRLIIDRVHGSSEVVSASSGQISASTEELAATTRAQAVSAEHTSQIMRAMAASIKRVAAHARDLAGNVDGTSASVEEMIASVQQVASNCDTLAGEVNGISASIEEMAASIRHVAQNLEQASEVAGN
ncbi:MAG TPA: methyl-accepting chemotaxis protein, partial [Stenomitos sp.]